LRIVLIVKMGTTLPLLAKRRGDFDDWIKASLGLDPNRIRVVKTYEGEDLSDPQQLSGIVITGSHAMVTDREDWSERTAAWIPSAIKSGTPLFRNLLWTSASCPHHGGTSRTQSTWKRIWDC
jgi:GMP synthase (glutamine-hydrolysing)